MVVHHLADSETNSYLRLRKLLAEDGPTLQGYDEAHWAEVLHYDRPDRGVARGLPRCPGIVGRAAGPCHGR